MGRKRQIAVVMALCVICSIAPFSARADLDREVALLKSGRAYVPLRAVFEWLGVKIDYINGSITATRDGDLVFLWIGSTRVVKNGEASELDVAPFEMGGKAFVPLRFVAEAFGADVEYHPEDGNISVSYEGREALLVVHPYRSGWLPFRGAWFMVEYPAHFTVTPREISASSAGYEAASFLSPDGLVEFYVFSPQWGGQSEWVRLQPGEKEIARSVDGSDKRTTTQVTYAGPQRSYERAWIEIRDTLSNTNWYFGFKYRDKSALDRYRPMYLQFRDSLVQYAD